MSSLPEIAVIYLVHSICLFEFVLNQNEFHEEGAAGIVQT